MIKVLFVCLGNICRSPMAEAIFRKKIKEAGLDDKISVDSAGTGDWHIGKRPHEGTLEILETNSIDHQGMAARQVTKEDINQFDYIIGMDASNIGNLHKLKGMNNAGGEIARLLDFVPEGVVADVPDPYFTGNFEEVYELIEEGCERLLQHIRKDRKN
ncbi:low molecular weight protein-tyrosine-phosphatase [Evansella cellulosilytica]|uniref:protein-tyrosine-phosphatase n=1 Tax=Evansella cellulosilytica (strain ATCC 21833 / DSM 2522 / FERM P-1141 / JCM 9156 / N-4) TaxID=649639 RepID=E6TYI3_EVAC2|nr:low molecular weight protein-tyrosine-phosphatase [Evansella cellulosilytica]ADU30033.1 protein tyrosine phosphatase [Evansella cellulosilytica DSM 2522]